MYKMKCSKCGSPIGENDSICENCGMQRNKNNDYYSKRLMIIFLIEFIIIIVSVSLIGIYYSKYINTDYATLKDFHDYANEKNYKFTNIDNNTVNKNVKQYYMATKGDNLGSHYIITNKKYADSIFSSLKRQFKSYANNDYYQKSIDLFDYNYYSLKINSDYFVVVKRNNVIFSATGISEEKQEIDTMVKDLGFDCTSDNIENIIHILVIISILIPIILFIVLWKIFVKAGKKGWYSLIPFYDYYCMSKIAFKKDWLFIFMLITPINVIVFMLWLYKIAKAFGKSTGFAICNIFFPYITMQIIAFDNSNYIEKTEL